MDAEKHSILGSSIKPTWESLLLLFTIMLVLSYQIFSTMAGLPTWVGSIWPAAGSDTSSDHHPSTCSGFFGGVPKRKVVMSIEGFGGVGDGATSNTEAFRRAILHMQRFGESGGAQLNVPKGRWLTGSFNLTSNFTLFLEEGAVILGSQVNKIFYLFYFLYFIQYFFLVCLFVSPIKWLIFVKI